MPVYTYRCDNCGHQFDKQQSFKDGPLKACPECHKHALYKVYKPAGVVFKGSGFYVTDNRSAKSSTLSTPSSSANGKENGASETKSSEKKTEKSSTAKSKD